ncbi:MAG: DUF2530 domain-containing protein [Candidatus Nanopelagicales bacterium]
MTEPDPVEVAPLDEDGVGAVAIGTIAWVIAFVVLWFLRDQLAASDAQWWLWVAGAGALLGLPGLWYTTRRRSAYRRANGATT